VSGKKTWDDDAIAKLRALWKEGHSTAEIGRRMGASKNMIVGKAHRLDLDARPSPIRRGPAKILHPDPAGRITLPQLASQDIEPPSPSTESSAPAAWLAWCDQLQDGEFNRILRAPHGADCPVTPQRKSVRLWECTCGVSQPGSDVVALPVKRQVVSGPVAPIIVRPAALTPIVTSEPTVFKQRRREPCCWPIGEGKSIRFCDSLAEPGRSYCSDHSAKGHVKIRTRAELTANLGAD
jgi:GcrA cell cycle regulator